MVEKHIELITQELGVSRSSVINTLQLLSEGATIPFIARYRKERTGMLDEVQIGSIQRLSKKYTELEDRQIDT
jgi:protein Tex